MRDLSLHLLDLLENSVRAQATAVRVTLAFDAQADRLRIVLEDDGRGLDVPAAQALDPFYTTKSGKRTGLGLPLFQASVEQAGGTLVLGRSPLGGLAIEATMQAGHIDRLPLGDLGATLSVVACTNPELDLQCVLEAGAARSELGVAMLGRELPDEEQSSFAVAGRLAERVRSELKRLGFPE